MTLTECLHLRGVKYKLYVFLVNVVYRGTKLKHFEKKENC